MIMDKFIRAFLPLNLILERAKETCKTNKVEIRQVATATMKVLRNQVGNWLTVSVPGFQMAM
jgi:ribosomal protein S17E